MPGAQPKGQHFVHRASVEAFQDPTFATRREPALWVYMPGKHPFRQRPERVAKRNYYYCYERDGRRDFSVETEMLQALEGYSTPILEKLSSGNFALTDEERLNFAGYVALTFTRVPVFQERTDRLVALMQAKQLEAVIHTPGALEGFAREIGEDAEKLRATMKSGSVIVEQSSRGWSIKQMAEVMLGLQPIINGMQWMFAAAPDGSDGFLTSDNPVCVFDHTPPFPGAVAFLSSPNSFFTFPLSSQICLIGAHKQVTSSAKFTEGEVREVNKGTISRCDQQLYASFPSTKIQSLLDKFRLGKIPKRVKLIRGRVVEE